jgi:hypothetical protein
LKAIAIALALLDFAPVFFLSLGLFFLAQLVDRLDPRSRRMALSAFALVTIGGLSRAASNLALAFTGQEIPVFTTSLYVFAGPGFTLMAAALIRGRSISSGRRIDRDPWVVPTLISWLFLIAAFYVGSRADGSSGWMRVLLTLAVLASALTCFVSGLLGWARQLHMAAALFAFNVGATAGFLTLRILAPQHPLIQLLGELFNLAAQAAFAFASWRVAAEYQARVGPPANR